MGRLGTKAEKQKWTLNQAKLLHHHHIEAQYSFLKNEPNIPNIMDYW